MKLHSPVARLALLGALMLGVAGCSNIKPTEDHLKTLSETNLAAPPPRASNVPTDSMPTTSTARTASGDYNCSVPSGASGGMFAVASFGMMKPAAYCQPKGARGNGLTPFN